MQMVPCVALRSSVLSGNGSTSATSRQPCFTGEGDEGRPPVASTIIPRGHDSSLKIFTRVGRKGNRLGFQAWG